MGVSHVRPNGRIQLIEITLKYVLKRAPSRLLPVGDPVGRRPKSGPEPGRCRRTLERCGRALEKRQATSKAELASRLTGRIFRAPAMSVYTDG